MSTTPLTARPAGTPDRLPEPLTRSRDGRWLAGVCIGLARHRKLPVRSVRSAFALAALVGGVGVLAYLACWLIIPAEGDEETGATGTRGIVVLAQACAGCVGLATLAGIGAAATIFGFGWAVIAIAAVGFVAALASWPRVGVGWALLPLAALVLPALAMTVGNVHIAPETRDVAIAPRSVADLPTSGYKSGLGTLLIDLRHTALPSTGTVSLRIDAGLRRTIVALPSKRCVYVDLVYDVVPFAARVASILSGRVAPYDGVTMFGDLQGGRAGENGNVPGPTPGSPILQIHFHSAGGSLYVRDYADQIDPASQPDWPGYPVSLEPRPDTTGTPRAAARRLIDGWLLRRRVQSASAATVNRLLPGPCGPAGTGPGAGAGTGTAAGAAGAAVAGGPASAAAAAVAGGPASAAAPAVAGGPAGAAAAAVAGGPAGAAGVARAAGAAAGAAGAAGGAAGGRRAASEHLSKRATPPTTSRTQAPRSRSAQTRPAGSGQVVGSR